jgi:hypothetical protein
VLVRIFFVAAAVTTLAAVPDIAWGQPPAAPAVVPGQPSAPPPPAIAQGPPPGGGGAGAAGAAGAPATPAVVPGQPSAPPAPPTPAAVIGTPALDPGIVEVPLDLAARTVKQVLPFDAPFHFTGTVPGGVAQIELQYMESRNVIVVTKSPTACGDPEIQVSTADRQASGWQPAYPSTWTYSPLLDQRAPVKFLLSVPALDAQRYYLFKLRLVSTVTPAAMAAIRQQARGLFDKTLDLVPKGTSLLAGTVEQIRQSVIADVKQALGADQVIAPGSLFDPCLDARPGAPASGAVRESFRQVLQVVVDSQDAIADNLGNLHRSRQALKAALDQIAVDQPLQRLLLRLALAAKSDQAIASFLQNDGGAELAAAQQTAAAAVLLGPDLPSPDAPSSAAASLDLTSLEQTYAGTVRRLDQLRVWLSVLAQAPSPHPTSLEQQLTAEDRQAIDALLSRRAATQGALTLAEGAAGQMATATAQLRDALGQREALLDTLAQHIAAKASQEVVADATTTGNADTFQHYFITADLGLLYAWGVSKLVPYAGTNIYFRPVNPDVPLSQKGGFGRRFSVTLGYTLQGIGDNGVTRKDLFGGGSLVVGAGLRLTESIRFAAGALLFVKENSNPLISDEKVAASPYLSLSFDWKIAKTFAVIGQKFFSSTP